MTTDSNHPAIQLAEGRIHALGSHYRRITNTWGEHSTEELQKKIARETTKESSTLRLMIAMRLLESAGRNPPRQTIDQFLTDFASHLDATRAIENTRSPNRPVIEYAAQRLHFASNLTPTNTKQDLRQAATRPFHASERLWIANLGINRRTFDTLVEWLEGGEGNEPPSPNHQSHPQIQHQEHQRSGTVSAWQPNWTTPSLTSIPDDLLSACRNWDGSEELGAEQKAYDLAGAWARFIINDFVGARAEMPGFYAQPPTWQPSGDVDSVRLWNWIRAVNQLADIDLGRVSNPRRAAASAFDLIHRALPNHDDLLDRLIDDCLADFAATDPGTKRAWCAYTTRLVARAGHEYVLGSYTNAEKATLRTALVENFRIAIEHSRTTNLVASAISSTYNSLIGRLVQGAKGSEPTSRILQETQREMVQCCDEEESELFDQVLEIALEIERAERPNHEELDEQARLLHAMARSIRDSGSILLQDGVLPHLHNLQIRVAKADSTLTDISRPEIRVILDSPRLPLSASKGSTFFARLRLANAGNATAESIDIHLVAAAASIDCRTNVPNLAAGAEVTCEVPIVSTGDYAAPTVTIDATIDWSDSLKQQFTRIETLTAEDQKPASWLPSDNNPYSLGTISDPARLVGREADLASLDAMLAGGGSIYITGQKRVGKTSLVRVSLGAARGSRGWGTGYLPLGRALGPDREAAELIYALMEAVYDAVKISYPKTADAIEPIVDDTNPNFSRAANRWLTRLASMLPDDARIIIAIDDFDELPPELVRGPHADAMFLFFRTLVDESWLNLIMVGSEVLPTIIAEQAHKLNQVAPYSVSNFASRTSTASLLTTPTRDRLDWDPEAIDRLHYICGGNPYYETLVAQHLWQSLREQSRSAVTVSDINQSVTTVANNAPMSHFVHLWADGSFGMDQNSRRSLVTSAALRAVARCSKTDLAASDTNEVISVAQSWISSARTDELNAVLIDLVARQVLNWGPSSGTVVLNIPLVAAWLLGAGARALDTAYAASPHATSRAYVVTESDLADLSRGLIYRGEHISEIRIQAWLRQFGESYHQHLAYKMLKRMITEFYFTHTRLNEKIYPRLSRNLLLLPSAAYITRDNNQYLKNAFLLLHGRPGDSSQAAFGVIGKQLKIKKANMLNAEDLAAKLMQSRRESHLVVFIVDDYSGSGTHLGSTPSLLSNALGHAFDDVSERLHVILGVGVASDDGVFLTHGNPIQTEHGAGATLGDRCRPFVDSSGVFSNSKEREDARDLAETIGRALLPKSPLGFGNEALLTLLEFNCPNNCPPIFWKSGQYLGKTWIPLFERGI